MKEDTMHRKIIKWFGDHMEPDSPFSIHRLVSLGASTGKKAGDWYGPASVAQILSQAVKLSSSAENSPFKNLAAYVSQDCAGTLSKHDQLISTSWNIAKTKIIALYF